ncbi:MAG: hypothetical protein Tsb0015_08680 [Simkaniaceae bacterium]
MSTINNKIFTLLGISSILGAYYLLSRKSNSEQKTSFLAEEKIGQNKETAALDLSQREIAPVASQKIFPVSEAVEILDDADFGKISIEPFSHDWLKDYPKLIEHIESEHLLHVKGVDEKGRGLNWHESKFTTDMDERLNPEAAIKKGQKGGFQMRVPYFIIPKKMLALFEAPSLSPSILRELEFQKDGKKYYRLFVHPSAFSQFRSLFSSEGIIYIDQQHSQFIGTPTSSYRSWIIRDLENIEDKSATPFIIKIGVGGSILGSDRWLSPNEIERSVAVQRAFDSMPKSHFHGDSLATGNALILFKETFGLYINSLEKFTDKNSGLLVREIPESLLNDKYRILSFASLMSTEQLEASEEDLAFHFEDTPELEKLPLIFKVIANSIQKGVVKTPVEFIEKFFIKAYLQAIENVVFKEGLTLEPHSQNLCLVLDKDFVPLGFAYRDFGGIWIDLATRGLQQKEIIPFFQFSPENVADNKTMKAQGAIAKGYINSFSWFYRYQVFIKILNVVTAWQSKCEYMPAPSGAPVQIGHEHPIPERNLQKYIISKIEKDEKISQAAKKAISTLSITFEQYKKVLHLLDDEYIHLLNKYFHLDKVNVVKKGNVLPAAEGGSKGDFMLYQHHGFLGKFRFNIIPSNAKRLRIEMLPKEIMEKILQDVITPFPNQKIEELQPAECLFLEKGICFINKEQEIVAFSPYKLFAEKKYIENQIEEL